MQAIVIVLGGPTAAAIMPNVRPINAVFRLLKRLALSSGIFETTLLSVYPYMHRPSQLEFLLRCVRETALVGGACVEVGCAAGATTVLLKQQADDTGPPRRYIAIDTFSGFLPRDVAHEVEVRGKSPAPYGAFRDNRREWVERTLRVAGVQDVELIEADCSTVDFTAFGAISFCLVDVDLYLPVRATLEAVYPCLAPGGVLIVDDCAADTSWDGARQAYLEFVEAQGLPAEIVCGKLGVIRKVG